MTRWEQDARDRDRQHGGLGVPWWVGVLLAILLLGLAAAVTKAQPPLPHVSVWRTTVQAGGQTLVWSRNWDLDPAEWEITGPGGTYNLPASLPSSRSVVWWDWHFYHALTVPRTVPAGGYSLLHKGVEVAKLAVTRVPRAARLTRFNPGASQGDVQEAWNRGERVELRPGLYEWASVLSAPPGAVLRGPGAVVRFTDSAVILPQDGLTVEGVTFVGDQHQTVAMSVLGNRAAANVSMLGCKLKHCFLGEFASPGLLVEDCEFDHAGSHLVGSNVLYRRCRWFGLAPLGAHPWATFGCRDSAVIDCTFQHVDRGVICQTTRSDVANCLFTGLVMEGLVHSQGGCEAIAFENPQQSQFMASGNMILHTRYSGNGHAVLWWNATAKGGLVRDLEANGGFGVEIAGHATQDGIELCEVEIRGGQLKFGPGATNTKCVRDWKGDSTVVVTGSWPTRGSAFHAPAPADWKPVVDWGQGNESANVTFRKDVAAIAR